MSRERKLEQAGYKFTGSYASGPDGKEQMKSAARALRSRGFFATVVHKVYHSRITSADGYSVYSKPKSA